MQNGHKDYDIPITAAEREARALRERERRENSLSSGGDSRPISLSSVTSLSASSSSREGDYDVPRPSNSLPPPPPPPPVAPKESTPSTDSRLAHSHLLSSQSSLVSGLSTSSLNSSNDNLGVWEEMNYEDSSEGSNGETQPSATEEDDVMLDNWIKELESGVKRMSVVTGSTSSPPPPTPPPTQVSTYQH